MQVARVLAFLGIPLLATSASVPLQQRTSNAGLKPLQSRQPASSTFKLCHNITLTSPGPDRPLNTTLSARCQNAATADFQNTLDLTRCIGVDPLDMTLGWAKVGQLGLFCSACDLALKQDRAGAGAVVQQAVLRCNCSDGGEIKVNSIRLDDAAAGIQDRDGVLVCRSNNRRADAVRLNPDAIVRTEPDRCTFGIMGHMDCLPRLKDGKNIIPVGNRDMFGSRLNGWRGH